jgi:hypothetical protein
MISGWLSDEDCPDCGGPLLDISTGPRLLILACPASRPSGTATRPPRTDRTPATWTSCPLSWTRRSRGRASATTSCPAVPSGVTARPGAGRTPRTCRAGRSPRGRSGRPTPRRTARRSGRRCFLGYDVQYFAAVEPQRRLAPHVHVAMRGTVSRTELRRTGRAPPPRHQPESLHDLGRTTAHRNSSRRADIRASQVRRRSPRGAAAQRHRARPRPALGPLRPDGDDGLIFTGPTGTPLRHSNFYRRVWLPTVKKAGMAGAA